MEWNLSANQLQSESKSDYAGLIEQCFKNIQNSHKLGKTWSIVEVPAFLIGRPFYDQAKSIDEICNLLTDKNFQYKILTNVKPPHIHIFVTWAVTSQRKRSKIPKEPVWNVNGNVNGSQSSEASSTQTQTTNENRKNSKKVMFENDALAHLDLTYNAMKTSGKLQHLKSFSK